jgi:predicted ATPase/DNA-binding CsgD family transcriptional regulator
MRRHNLPAPLTTFVGRVEALAALANAMAATRLLTLTGVGGIGKTRLAIEMAQTLIPRTPDGVWLVELASLTDPSLLPRTIALALPMPTTATTPAASALIAWLESRDLVLVLDNCEHLVVPLAVLADRLLRACPALKIVATSREPLGISGETVWRVPGLRLDHGATGLVPGSPLDAERPSEASTLFIERARAARSGLRLDARDLNAVAEICRRLDGMPLAIELAAARVSVLGVRQIARRLDDRFQLLTSGSRSALPRHQTLRALIDWSYDQLSSDERTILRRLAVFVGGWSVDAAEAICGGQVAHAHSDAVPHRGDPSGTVLPLQILDVLSCLTAKSLILADEQPGETRFRMLETIREYAHEKMIESGENASLRRRHLGWCVAFATEAHRHMQGPDQALWLARVEAEGANLRVALEYTRANDQLALGLRLGRALWQFWRARGHLVEGREALEALLAHPAALHPDLLPLRIDVAVRAGNLSLERGEFARARTHLEWAIDAARSSGSLRLEADALTQLGHVARQEHRWGVARERYEEALHLRQSLGDRLGEAWALGSLGHLAIMQRDLGRAQECYQQGLDIVRELENWWEVATFLRLLGKQASDANDWHTAHQQYIESLSLFGQLGDRRGAVATIEGLAGVAAASHRAECALRLSGYAEVERELLDAPLSPHDRERVLRQTESARHSLGPDRSAELLARGRRMSLDDAMAAVSELRDLDPGGIAIAPNAPLSPGTTHTAATSLIPLTVREREVAALIAGGANNLEIAAELVITRRTVEAHVSAILGKLGLSTRTQLAIWAVERGLRTAPAPA